MSSNGNKPSSRPPATHVHAGRDYRAGDRIDSIGTQNNNRVKHTYNGNNHSINHGRDQNINNGPGHFSVNHGVEDALLKRKAEDEAAERENDKNPFRKLNNSNPGKARSDTEILERMKGVVGDERRIEAVLKARDAKAEGILEGLQRASYSSECEPELKSSILNVMWRLSEASGRSVPCYYNAAVQKQEDKPHSSKSEAFVEVWKGMIGDGFPVALKVVKQKHMAEVDQKLRTHFREMLNIRAVNNSKVLSFIGNFSFGPDKEEICLVTPWMEKGNIVEYLRANRSPSLQRFSFAWDIACGLEHLHGLGIIHGNLKGGNVVINSNEFACITDFGLVPILQPAGKVRPTPWSAPELLEGGPPTENSDVYAYGSVCYEIFTGHVPFYNLDESRLRKAILDPNHFPERPSGSDSFPWGVMERCWSTNSDSRPPVATLVKEIEGMVSSFTSQEDMEVDEIFFEAA